MFPRVLVATLLVLSWASGRGAAEDSSPRSLAFVHTHTGESIRVEFKRNGVYSEKALSRLTSFLRDHRNGKSESIDPRLFDLLYELRERVGSKDAFHLVSAYRSPETNQMLRRTTSGVAKKSMHVEGRAIDIRLPGVATRRLRDIALELGVGGVGYYESSDFLHVDTGRVRRW